MTLFLPRLTLLLAFLSWLGFCAPSGAAPVFSVSGFVDEEIYKGNGMISLRFDASGRMWVTEKQGRILMFAPNTSGNTGYNYEYYHKPDTTPNWAVMPDFSSAASATLIKSGTVNSFTLDPKERGDYFAFRYTGPLFISNAGTYTFYLASDDGSKLYIDGVLVVNHDGTHGATEKSETVSLTSGVHEIRVEFFDAGGGESLSVQYSGPGVPKGPVSNGPFLAPVVFANLSSQVSTGGETGMTGMALDPDFANNRYLYVLYATSNDQRISRLTANTSFTAMVPGSETVLLSGLPNVNNVHKAGDMAFQPNDPHNLYVMLGDDGNRNLVSSLTTYNGKILKINAADGKGLPGNPYYDGNVNSIASRVWSARYRNPFRFVFDPLAPINDVLYISENGDGTDRLARIEKGADGGWDNVFTSNSADGKRKILQTSEPSKTAIALVRNGPLAPGGAPVLYNARYGGGDRNEVRRWTLTGAGLDQLTPLAADAGQAFFKGYEDHGIVDFAPGPDGALYYTDSGQGPSTGNNFRIGRIRFVGGSEPVANFTALPSTGTAPLAVTFTDTSTAPGSTLSSWTWNFGDGTTSALQNPAHSYAQPGVYTVSLTVANALGLTQSKEQTVTAYHSATVSLTGQILDGRSLPAGNLNTATELRFYQKDGVTPLSFPGGGGAQGNAWAVPAGGSINASVALQITGDAIVVSAGEPTGDGLGIAYAGVSLSISSANQNATVNFRLSDTMLRGRLLDTKKTSAPADLGLSRGSSGSFYAFAGGRDYLAASGIPASGVLHRTVPDSLGYYHIPIPTGGGGAMFFLDTSADTLASSHGRVYRNVQVDPGITTVLNLTLGLYNGGTGESDLSSIAETPNVNFSTQIQPIFTASCAACHNDIATNSGGLDLQASAALLELVNQTSVEAPGVKLVDPGAPERSYLMEKINALTPQIGTSMRPGDLMSLSQRALIRDWIKQLDVSGKLEFSSAVYTVQEGKDPVNATVTVHRSGNSAGAVGITVATVAGGSASSGSDYTATVTQLAWADGDSANKTVSVPVLPDSVAEGNETVSLQLSLPTGGATPGTVASATLTIQDRPFDAWRLLHFGAEANQPKAQPTADFDGDSLSNLVEYGLNKNPALNQNSGAPVVEVGAANKLQISFTRNLASSGLIYRVEASNTLAAGSWQVLAAKEGSAAWTTAPEVAVSDQAQTGAVVVTDSETITGSSKRFLRLKVERATD